MRETFLYHCTATNTNGEVVWQGLVRAKTISGAKRGFKTWTREQPGMRNVGPLEQAGYRIDGCLTGIVADTTK